LKRYDFFNHCIFFYYQIRLLGLDVSKNIGRQGLVGVYPSWSFSLLRQVTIWKSKWALDSRGIASLSLASCAASLAERRRSLI
jgi:hypothetical protein